MVPSKFTEKPQWANGARANILGMQVMQAFNTELTLHIHSTFHQDSSQKPQKRKEMSCRKKNLKILA